MKNFGIILAFLFFTAIPAKAQFGPDGTYWLPCTMKAGKCLGIVLKDDGSFWIDEFHDDGTKTDVKPANCPNWHEPHPLRLSVTDPELGGYRCLYAEPTPGPFSAAIKQPIKESRGAKFWHYVGTHKEVLAGDALVIVAQSVWALKATEYHHVTGPEGAAQATGLTALTVFSNHFFRYIVNKNGMNDGDQHAMWLWNIPVQITSWSRVNDYEQGSNTPGLGPPGAIPVPRLPHYR